MASELEQYATAHIQPTTARNQAYLLIRKTEEMTHACLRDYQPMRLSFTERARMLEQLVTSLGHFDWSTLGLDPEKVGLALDDETRTLLITRIVQGESLTFLENLLYERLIALERNGATPEAVSALRLVNTRRRRTPYQSLQSPRHLRNLSRDLE